MQKNSKTLLKAGKMIFIVCFLFLAAACGTSEISIVKDGYLGFDQSVKFGDALEAYTYFDSADWQVLEDAQKRKIVEFVGKIDGDKIDMQTGLKDLAINIQCVVYPDQEAFDLIYIGASAITPDCGQVEIPGDVAWIHSLYNDEVELVSASADYCLLMCEDQKDQFIAAASRGNIQKVKKFLEKGMNVNAKNEDGVTALIDAPYGGEIEIVNELLSHGANVNATDNKGQTALMSACDRIIDIEFVNALLANGADVNVEDERGKTALQIACQAGRDDTIQALIAHGADINTTNKSGSTGLMMVARKGNANAATVLISHGIDINAQNDNGETALIIASKQSDGAEIVQTLISNGADADAKDKSGNTALMHAASQGHLDIVKLIAPKVKDINSKNKRGNNALWRAYQIDGYPAVGHRLEIMKTLMDNGADPDIRNKNGEVLLVNAYIDRQFNILKALVAHGADVNAEDKYGNTVPSHIYQSAK